MRCFWLKSLLISTFVWGLGSAAMAAGPQRDLTVELRQIEEGRGGGARYSAGSPEGTDWEPQMVQVRNGEKAVLRLNDAIPMQWMQSVSTQNAPANNNLGQGTPNTNASSSVTQAMVWFDAGQSISVKPQWAGGNKPVVLELEVQRAAAGGRVGLDLPKQTRNTVSTTVTLPLAEWITIAATGTAPKAGTYNSESGNQVRRVLQVRVMAP